jgi:hypothetical protein
MTINPDSLHRTVKLEMDSGRAATEQEARQIVSQYVLQIVVGAGVRASQTRQAALLTAVNAGTRAFLGGVRVKLEEGFSFTTAWANGQPASKTIAEFAGAEVVGGLDDSRPTIVIGETSCDSASPLQVTWQGWAAGVVPSPSQRLAESQEMVLSGVLAGALAVSEAFQRARGSTVAAARAVGVSLWRPGLDWRDTEAPGPPLQYLPSNLWLLGLGHLGQAYAWSLGFLPYADADRPRVRIMLQDVDAVVEANESTSMLVPSGERGLKTRLVGQRLGGLGFDARLTERLFDQNTHRQDDEPRIALAGFHSPAPRRLLEGAAFDLVVDGGLGATVQDYLGIRVNRFPSQRAASDVFADPAAHSDEHLLEQPAYRAAVADAVKHEPDVGEEAAKCGVLEIAGKAVGAAFVGCVASTLCLSEVLRVLADGPRYAVLDLTLRSPKHLAAAPNEIKDPFVNPGFVVAAPPDSNLPQR